MARKIRNVINRPATAEEQERHRNIRAQVATEFPRIQAQGREILAETAEARRHLDTVFNSEEEYVFDAIDQFAASNSLANRGAVVRMALSKLLGIEIAQPHHGWQPGRTRKADSAS